MNIKKNYSEHFKQEVLEEIAKMFYNGILKKEANRIPFNIIPKGQEAEFRCCEYKERAILKLRVLAAFGYSVNEIDESISLNDYAYHDNPDFDHSSDKLLTILRSACKHCVKSRYMVSEICQGCLSRACVRSCHFNAIDVKNRKAAIDKDLCKNCGRCKETCPYGAIFRITVPCEESCPVGAIKKGDKDDDKDSAVIDHSLCISCGKCIKACPFGAVIERTQFLDILKLTNSNVNLAALIAPSIVGQFGVNIGRLKNAIKQLGFKNIYEVASGADITAKMESCEFFDRVLTKGEAFMTTSCCHSYVRLVDKHITELKSFVSNTKTPLHYTAELAHKDNPYITVVFISPCLSKRKEAQKNVLVDFVLSFEELKAMINAKGINLVSCKEEKTSTLTTKEALKFGIRGGVINAIKRYSGNNADLIKGEMISGLNKKNILKLKSYTKGHNVGNLIEVMCCDGGCVGGCNVLCDVYTATKQINKYADENGK
ncbi:MAG: monomeric [FeFe] hydrogenase [Endomicrobium sp.]|jgi:[FeFe] hydrogenase (group B1/B3)|nr:monomeric [FeFe] hydrogenase [Endomicrobium sp.]